MAISFGTSSNSGSIGSVSSYTFTHQPVGTGNLLLVVGQFHRLSGVSVGTVLWNGTASTKIRSDTTGQRYTSLWYYAGPDTTLGTVTVQLSAAQTDGAAGAITLVGVNQASPLDANNGTIVTPSGTQISGFVTTVGTNTWIVDSVACGSVSSGGPLTLDAKSPQTKDFSVLLSASIGGMSYQGTVTSAGSTNDGWTGTSANASTWALSIASFAPFIPATGRISTLGLMSAG